MNTKECCNQNCNQGRDCPLRQRNLAEEITEGFKSLESMRNNKPVAWINKTGSHGYLEWDKDDEVDESVPLYTHPAKTLTDEEITDIASTLLIATDSIEYEWGVCVTEFARTILRKAQEK
jgi:hypothetical protein